MSNNETVRFCKKCRSCNIEKIMEGFLPRVSVKENGQSLILYRCKDCGSSKTIKAHPLVLDILNYFSDSLDSSKVL